jgi:hypothetical protein
VTIDVDKLEQKLLQIQGKIRPTENDGFRFWKPREAHVIRIVPHTPQFVELMYHYDVDPNGPIVCPATFNRKCPIDNLRIKLYKSGTDEDKVIAKKLKTVWRFFAPVVVRESNKPESELKPMWWTFSRTIYESIIRYCKNPEYGDISDPVSGTDLDIVLTKAQKKGEFSKTSISPKRRSSALASSEEEIKRITDSVPDMMKEIKELSFDELQKIADNWLDSMTSTKVPEDEEEVSAESIDEVFKEINE